MTEAQILEIDEKEIQLQRLLQLAEALEDEQDLNWLRKWFGDCFEANKWDCMEHLFPQLLTVVRKIEARKQRQTGAIADLPEVRVWKGKS